MYTKQLKSNDTFKKFTFLNFLVGLISQANVVIKLFDNYSVKNKLIFFIQRHLLTSLSKGKTLKLKDLNLIPRIYEKSIKRKLRNYAKKCFAVSDSSDDGA